MVVDRVRARLWSSLSCSSIAIVWLFYAGIGIWGIDWPVVWGFAIINYVWWIAIASGGTFISALFYLVQVEWRTSLNRLAETMTVFAAACAGIYPILHLGPAVAVLLAVPLSEHDDAVAAVPQPAAVGLLRDPHLCDLRRSCSGISASCRISRRSATVPRRAGRQVFYGVLALGFRGSERQWRHYHVTYGVLAAIMAPLVVSVHSIVGLDFAGAATLGWHSTQFPPFFVFGALLSGFAVVLALVVPMRRLLGLEGLHHRASPQRAVQAAFGQQPLPRLFLHDGRLHHLLWR